MVGGQSASRRLVVVLWVATVFWVCKDARRRIETTRSSGSPTRLRRRPPFLGPLVYMLFRPPEYLEDVRERELEIKAIEQRLGAQACPVCRAEVSDEFLVCPVCTTKLRQACSNCARPLEQSWQVCPYCETPIEAEDGPVAVIPRPASRRSSVNHWAKLPAAWLSQQTLILAKPDAVARNLAGEILARFERRGLKVRAAQLVVASRELGAAPLRRAQREAVLRRARRLHHLRADARVRARGRGSDRDRAQDDRRDEPGRGRPGLAPRRVRARDAEQPRARLRLAGVGRARDRALVPRWAGLRTRRRNRDALDEDQRRVHRRPCRGRSGSSEEITWGIWETPESELGVLGDVAGLDVVELGCGTAYFSAWLARRGARPVGVDITPAQLDSARAHDGRVRAWSSRSSRPTARRPGCRTRAATSSSREYGASIWVDPERWLPEAARLLRPGGRLVFMCVSTLLFLCTAGD